MDHARRSPTDFRSKRAQALLWLAFVAGPLAWGLGLGLDYSLVRVACAAGNEIPLHLVSLVTLGLALGGGYLSWVEWTKAGREEPGEGGDVLARTRFMSVIGLLGSLLFSVTILAQWISKLFLNPCMAI